MEFSDESCLLKSASAKVSSDSVAVAGPGGGVQVGHSVIVLVLCDVDFVVVAPRSAPSANSQNFDLRKTQKKCLVRIPAIRHPVVRYVT